MRTATAALSTLVVMAAGLVGSATSASAKSIQIDNPTVTAGSLCSNLKGYLSLTAQAVPKKRIKLTLVLETTRHLSRHTWGVQLARSGSATSIFSDFHVSGDDFSPTWVRTRDFKEVDYVPDLQGTDHFIARAVNFHTLRGCVVRLDVRPLFPR